MAVKPANSRYHTFTFNGVRAADYGIYVTDVNVFNSAARDVEYIQIPGRDGAFALDRGRFQNISVVYKCAMTQDTDEDFATAISEFRNAIASTKGYKRLEDDIHTDEYRMGVFSKGLEAPTLNTKTATFDVEFNCQPQRFLKSGETAVSVASGGTLTNPTLFESHPLLKVWGYGDIVINGETITISDEVVGDVILSPQSSVSIPFRKWYIPSATNKFRSGDDMRLGNTTITLKLNFSSTASSTYGELEPDGATIFTRPAAINDETIVVDPTTQTVTLTLSTKKLLSFSAFGGGNLFVGNVKFGVPRVDPDGMGDSTTYVTNLSLSLVYGTDADGMYLRPSTDIVSADEGMYSGKFNATIAYGEIRGYSTKSALGEPLYFDLDIGEAYKEEDGAVISVNNAVSFPARLPVLKSGANTITYDDTVDQFKIVPRWWEV